MKSFCSLVKLPYTFYWTYFGNKYLGKKEVGGHPPLPPPPWWRHNFMTTVRILMIFYYNCWVLIVLNYWGAELSSSDLLYCSTLTRLVSSYYDFHSAEGNCSWEVQQLVQGLTSRKGYSRDMKANMLKCGFGYFVTLVSPPVIPCPA